MKKGQIDKVRHRKSIKCKFCLIFFLFPIVLSCFMFVNYSRNKSFYEEQTKEHSLIGFESSS